MKKLLLLVICVSFLSGCNYRPNPDLTIAVAANMQFAMDEIVDAFKDNTGLNCDVVTSSSGKLTAQIMEGAPFDVLVSADMKYPEELYRAGLTKERPAIYAYGKLILWSIVDNYLPSIEDLDTPSIQHIALANPKIAPYGIASMEVLDHYGLRQTVADKLVFGESISQTNQFIISGAAEVGFTAKSVVLSPQMKEVGSWIELNQDHYSPIAQGIVLIENENSVLSRQFFDFLFSPEGQFILQKYGYSTGE